MLEQHQRLAVSRDDAWEFFSTPRNLNQLTPPDVGFKILSQPGERLYEGQIITYRISVLPLASLSWVTEIKSVEVGKSFVDEQRFGPYAFWHHRHTFEDADGGVVIGDHVHYAVGWGPIGAFAHAMFVRRKLEAIFAFRRKFLAARFGEIG